VLPAKPHSAAQRIWFIGRNMSDGTDGKIDGHHGGSERVLPMLVDHSTWCDRATWPMRTVSSMRHDRLGDAGWAVAGEHCMTGLGRG
jgi:hypothetical protein